MYVHLRVSVYLILSPLSSQIEFFTRQRLIVLRAALFNTSLTSFTSLTAHVSR
eukprot:m.265281 g.265281  ORF g.265281 m.265281 type:complete len:53 (+) comp61012_c0_seq1:40-198(+)